MIVEVVGGTDEVPEARVVHVDDVGSVHLALGEVTDDEARDVLARAGLGRMHDDGSATLDVAALRAASEPRVTTPGWSTRWDAMIASARSEGRLSPDGAGLTVPVESAAGG